MIAEHRLQAVARQRIEVHERAVRFYERMAREQAWLYPDPESAVTGVALWQGLAAQYATRADELRSLLRELDEEPDAVSLAKWAADLERERLIAPESESELRYAHGDR
jgi:hypothetical protein